MSLQNVFELDIDIKQKTAIKIPSVTQNDSVIFLFRILDDGRILNIQSGAAFTLMTIRPDRRTIITGGEFINDNVVKFALGTTEQEVPGIMQAVVQVYDKDGRISSIPFRYDVAKDPSNDYVPSTKEKTLIEQVLFDGPQIMSEAQAATEYANGAAVRATNAALNAANEASHLSNLKKDVVAATTNANAATSNASEAATKATNAAQNASNEASNLSQLKNDVTKAKNDATTAATNANQKATFAETQGNFAMTQAAIAQQRTTELEGVDAAQFKKKQDEFASLLSQFTTFTDVNTKKKYTYNLEQRDGHVIFVYKEVL